MKYLQKSSLRPGMSIILSGEHGIFLRGLHVGDTYPSSGLRLNGWRGWKGPEARDDVTIYRNTLS